MGYNTGLRKLRGHTEFLNEVRYSLKDGDDEVINVECTSSTRQPRSQDRSLEGLHCCEIVFPTTPWPSQSNGSMTAISAEEV